MKCCRVPGVANMICWPVAVLSWFSKSKLYVDLLVLTAVLWPLKSNSSLWLPGPQPSPDQIQISPVIQQVLLSRSIWEPWECMTLQIISLCIKLWAMYSEKFKHGESIGTGSPLGLGVHNRDKESLEKEPLLLLLLIYHLICNEWWTVMVHW